MESNSDEISTSRLCQHQDLTTLLPSPCVNHVVSFIRNRGLPTTVWASTTQDVGDDMTANVRADVDVESKNAVIDCRLNSGRDSVAVDFDTADSTMGPLRITKHLDLNGRKVGILATLYIYTRLL